MPDKFEFIKESRRVARPGARTHFSVILPAENLAPPDHKEVLDTGPPFIGVDGNYSDMLRESGWDLTECQDVTADYKDSLQRLVDGIIEHEEELSELLGPDDVLSKRIHREDQISLITRGLMRREAFAATAV